jgi:L-asparaginase
MSNLCIMAVGGTFDKRYNPLDGSLGFGDSHIPQLLADARLNNSVRFEVVMQIDSLDMLDTHREQLLQRCRAATETKLLLVHGTDTMTDSAQVLAQANLPKVIVITGAMVPYALEQSDATFNLGFALGCLACLTNGVYIAMGGQVFSWDQVLKNKTLGRFQSKE